MSNKTIAINPSLFSTSTIHTRKKYQKKEKKPLISPNVLKTQLLKRIKQHKQSEINTKSNSLEKSETTIFSDEFNESVNYLQTLSKQKKIKDNIEMKKQELERKTLKNYNDQTFLSPHVNIELPEELTEPLVPINTEQYNPINEVPYGILKNGLKPTYRNWIKTQRNNNTIMNNPTNLETPVMNLRENRLNNLREKIKQKNVHERLSKQEEILMNSNVINKTTSFENIDSDSNSDSPNPTIEISLPLSTNQNTEEFTNPHIDSSLSNTPIPNTNSTFHEDNVIATKKITTKTIKKTYTLGKNKSKNIVSLLIKDRGTRKQILSAHKNLKSKSINDIKSELRKYNLIKAGSNAPNDVLRKLYESSMLTGEVVNLNTDFFLQNKNLYT
jgi:hypothetical protein